MFVVQTFLTSYSYVQLDENKIIVDVREKHYLMVE